MSYARILKGLLGDTCFLAWLYRGGGSLRMQRGGTAIRWYEKRLGKHGA
jgi:hypothetical protein